MAESRKRFAVIGLGNIAQAAVLPAFEHARERCELVALVSSDADKLAELGRRYGVEHTGSYDDLEDVLAEAEADAAYIALPNAQHRVFTERCAHAGVHVLCEKPMATSVEDCDAMIEVCDEQDVKLMIAYRLHFEPANLHAIELARSGRLGELRFFSSVFGQQVREGDIRTRRDAGGGALFDMGVYCVNAARYLFRDEPFEVFGWQTDEGDPRFEGVDASTVALLRFPGDRLAQLSCSQASADVDTYRLVGTQGDLRVEPAFSYHDELVHYVTVGGRTKEERFPKLDHFAPELLHFAQCIDEGVDPEPSGEEGLADVRVMQAIVRSARSGRSVELPPYERTQRPDIGLEMRKPPVRKPRTVRAPSPSR
ncbi:MAG TPA: Gfo/Idh/MocA family oxidoreductase [Polyangiaceae bacterium]